MVQASRGFRTPKKKNSLIKHASMCDGYDIFVVPNSSTQEGSLFTLWTAILFFNLNVRVIRRVKKSNQKVSYFIFDCHMYVSDILDLILVFAMY